MKKVVIIFSGYNQRAVIAFLRTLEKTNVGYTIIASSPKDSIFLTKYSKRVSAIRKTKALDIEDLLCSIECAKESLKAQKYIIAPSTEALNRFLVKHRDDFEKQDCEIPLVDEVLYAKVSDKYSFSKLCKQQGVCVPAEYTTIETTTIPCVAKPKKYIDTDGKTHSPVLIHTKDDLMKFKKSFNMHGFYFQEFVEGESIYLLYYFSKDGTVAKFSQKNLMQQPDGKSIIAAISSDFHKDQESDKYEKLFSSIGFSGMVMVEVKKRANSCYMIEANPRFWGPSQLFVDADTNLFAAFLFDNDLIDTKPNFSASHKKTRYFWYGGMVATEADGLKVSCYSYNKKKYEQEKIAWLEADVYNREDTKNLFKNESGE